MVRDLLGTRRATSAAVCLQLSSLDWKEVVGSWACWLHYLQKKSSDMHRTGVR
jgi:hypothetical protein